MLRKQKIMRKGGSHGFRLVARIASIHDCGSFHDGEWIYIVGHTDDRRMCTAMFDSIWKSVIETMRETCLEDDTLNKTSYKDGCIVFLLTLLPEKTLPDQVSHYLTRRKLKNDVYNVLPEGISFARGYCDAQKLLAL